MAVEIPYDLIRRVQISLRKEASFSSYDPGDPSLPSFPSSQQTLAQLDPSPPYLRCKHCEARLLRGIQSLICLFCGRHQGRDPPPDPLNFRDTLGCRWFLESLKLDGSEMAGPFFGKNESIRGQNTQKDEVPLSDLLNLEIRWSAELEKVESTVLNEVPVQGKSSLDLAAVDLDNFFADRERDTGPGASEEQMLWNKEIGSTKSDEFQVRENLNLDENVRPSVTATTSIEVESGDSFSGWEANFQSAGSGVPHEENKFDTFVASVGDLSSHFDAVFGSGKDSTDAKGNDSTAPSESKNDVWFQDDLWSSSNSGVIGQTEPVKMTANLGDGRLAENVNNSSSMNVDWLQVDLWQTNTDKAPDNKATDENDDELDAWNDFTSSTSVQDPPTSSWNQTVNHAAPSVDGTSEVNLFSSPNNLQDMDFGSFSQAHLFSGTSSNTDGATEVKNIQSEPSVHQTTLEVNLFSSPQNLQDMDFGSFSQAHHFPGTSSNPNGASEVNNIQSEPSVSDRLPPVNSKVAGDPEDVAKGEDVCSTRNMSDADDVEKIMSQMKDLTFMLESNLSIPKK